MAFLVSLAFSVLFASVVALIFWLFPSQIVSTYSDSSNQDNTQAVKMAISLLNWAALLQLFHGIQANAMAALIGLKDTRVPMIVSVLAEVQGYGWA